MQTSEYPYCKFKFEEFNPLQEHASRYFTQKCSLCVSASVAAGKSAIHEAIAGYELSQDIQAKVIYTCPLKAIAQQKYFEWKQHETFQKYKIVMLSSDNYVTIDELQSARIIVATIQSVNVCCRRKDKWLKNVKLLTFDQAHLFNHQKRGAGSQALIMNISMINSQCRFLCLSGTLSNIKQIAKWLKGLNGLPTYYIDSKWRPTKLFKRIQVSDTTKQQIEFVSKLIQDNYDDKILIFVHSKKIGQHLRKQLRQNGIRCVFYSSDLTFENRKQIIQRFKDQYDQLRVLIATNSLSMGISL